ncbi:MAG TPA: MarR family transcriptional regulator [Candidatus Dormibacteraeota bacterium]|nr:MarR family transcriptional regulator [Candidatus Dormibacteraeota bacterium]
MAGQPRRAPDPPEDSEERIVREITRLADELVGRIWFQFQARVAELSLSVPEARALQALEPDRSLPMRELAARLRANPSNLTVAVGRLEARGLVGRHGDEDRRVRGARLTDAGVELRRRLETRLVEDHPAVAGLSPPQRETLYRLLLLLSERAAAG